MANPIQESRFDYKGFPCVVLFQPMGHRTGYVGLPKENKYYGSIYDDIPVSCHGGLTYSRGWLALQNDKNTWWIGFDCGHCCDGYDVEKAKEYYANDPKMMQRIALMEKTGYYAVCNNGNPVRSKEYVENGCKGIVDQLVRKSEGK